MNIRVTKGNVFKVKLSNGYIRYFQFLGKDVSELNGDVIVIFKKHYTDEQYNMDEILQDEIEYFMHTSVSFGVKLGLWERVFTSPVSIPEADIVFRTSQDIGLHPRQHFVSHRWVVWSMNGDRRYVGTLPKKYYKADLGGVYAPIHVIIRLETGEVPDKYYPSY